MTDSVAMAFGTLHGGRVYDLPEDRAKELIDKGLARSLARDTEKPIFVKRKSTSLPHGDRG